MTAVKRGPRCPSGVTGPASAGSAGVAIYHDQTGPIKRNLAIGTEEHGITKLARVSCGPGLVEAKGVFEGDRIAGRVVKYVDPGKSTKGESSPQGHSR